MEIIRFILSSFWIWLGFLILIVAAGSAVVEIIKAIHPTRKIDAYRIGERWHIEIDGAGRGDVAAAIREVKKKRKRGRDDECGAFKQ